MAVSNKVVALTVFALSLVASDYYLAHQQAKDCRVIADPDVLFSFNQLSHDFASNTSLSLPVKPNITVNQRSFEQLSQCLEPQHNLVSWWDWVFSDAQSNTFHYLDLLELITPDNDEYSSNSPRPGQ
jgi:hypothetical protein